MTSFSTVLAIDAMGGDAAPEATIRGLGLAIKKTPQMHYLVFGDSAKVPDLMKQHGLWTRSDVEFIATEQTIPADMRPSTAIRHGRSSSMWLATEAVQQKRAAAVLSSGNTGAYMAMAKVLLKTMPGIDRPAIARVIPTLHGSAVFLDLGANVECSPRNLVDFAIMGEALAIASLGLETPRVALLNIGTESVKGTPTIQKTASFLQEGNILRHYVGFVEADEMMMSGKADVIVTDGFTGNVALKMAEGMSRFVMWHIRDGFKRNIFGKLAGLIAKPALQGVFKKMDPRLYNGAVLLGLTGLVVKSHGGTDAVGFAHAIEFTASMVREKILDHVTARVEACQDRLEDL